MFHPFWNYSLRSIRKLLNSSWKLTLKLYILSFSRYTQKREFSNEKHRNYYLNMPRSQQRNWNYFLPLSLALTQSLLADLSRTKCNVFIVHNNSMMIMTKTTVMAILFHYHQQPRQPSTDFIRHRASCLCLPAIAPSSYSYFPYITLQICIQLTHLKLVVYSNYSPHERLMLAGILKVGREGGLNWVIKINDNNKRK